MQILKNALNYSSILVLSIYKPIIIYVACMLLHNISSNLYTELCAPRGFKGIMMSIFTINTPHCESLRWVIVHTSLEINNMWFLILSYISCLFIKNIAKK